MINATKVNYYSDLGIDVFNLEDEFFNDICYSYSEGGSDMILNDRVADIYHNYSVCEDNCNYNKINLTENTVSCKCSIKTTVEVEVTPPKLDTIIRDSFRDSNLAVMKCYNVVFSFNNKMGNIGFFIFTTLVLLHLPFFIYYFIYNITSIRKFIFAEMGKFNYWFKTNYPPKKDKSNKSLKIKRNIIQTSSNQKESLEAMIEKKNKKKNIKGNTSSRMNLYIKKSKILKGKRNSITNVNIKNELNNKKTALLKNNKTKINRPSITQKNLQTVLLFDCKVLNKNIIKINNENQRKITVGKNKTNKEKIKINSKGYSLIQLDADNSKQNTKPPNSDFLLDNYDYETALIYDNRKFWRIFYICLIAKENIINIFLFRTPLDLQSLRYCLFIFTYSCDLAFNTIFYSTQNISDKYHYKGDNLFLFTIVNNLVQTIISAIIGLILVNVFQHLIDVRNSFEDIFRKEEKKMRKNKKYKVSEETKKKILNKIRKISLKWKCKIILFIIFEFSMMLFFYYFVTAFCDIYKNTQISWIYDFFLSFIISFATEIFGAFMLAILYILSLKYKLKFVYTITIFLYSI